MKRRRSDLDSYALQSYNPDPPSRPTKISRLEAVPAYPDNIDVIPDDNDVIKSSDVSVLREEIIRITSHRDDLAVRLASVEAENAELTRRVNALETELKSLTLLQDGLETRL